MTAMPRRTPNPVETWADLPEGLPPTEDQRMVSLADVASLAGVSTGTVSRALSKPDMISAATRQRVQQAAERLGYVANGAARALALRKTQTVGALVPRFGGSSFPKLVQALETTLAAAGYTLLLSAPDHRRLQTEAPAIVRALLERGVDGVALLGAEQPPAVFAMLAAHRLPFVMLWAEHSVQGACVGFDEHAAAALAVNHLHGLGHRRIGFIGGDTADNERARRRFNGLLQAVAGCGMTLVADAALETDYGFREGFEAMQAVLARKPSITAMVCGNDYLAAGALAALDQAGVQVPQQMSVVSFNDNDFAAYLHPPLSTVRVPISRMGELAAQYLLLQLQGLKPAAPALLPVELVVRASTGPAPLAPRRAKGR
jgi:LacI family transcriptional regulator